MYCDSKDQSTYETFHSSEIVTIYPAAKEMRKNRYF